MRQYNYICASITGCVQRGHGMTSVELGSMEHVMSLLNEVAKLVQDENLPWDPFNVTLIVRAQNEPKQFYTPSDL